MDNKKHCQFSRTSLPLGKLTNEIEYQQLQLDAYKMGFFVVKELYGTYILCDLFLSPQK